MDTCLRRNIKFGHVSPFTDAELMSMTHGLKSGTVGKMFTDFLLSGKKPSVEDLSRAAGVKRPMSIVLLAANGLTGSFAYHDDGNQVTIAVSVVGTKDHFCRRRGRQITGQRLLAALDSDVVSMIRNPTVWIFHRASPTYRDLPIYELARLCFLRTIEAWQERGHGKGVWSKSRP